MQQPDFAQWLDDFVTADTDLVDMLRIAYERGLEDSKVVKLPKIPLQWPAQVGPDGVLRLVKQPERPLAKVIPFPFHRIKRDDPTPPQDDPPPGGSPIAAAA